MDKMQRLLCSGAVWCQDASVYWILCNLTQGQIDECVNSSYDEDSGLRTITVDTRGYEAGELVLS